MFLRLVLFACHLDIPSFLSNSLLTLGCRLSFSSSLLSLKYNVHNRVLLVPTFYAPASVFSIFQIEVVTLSIWRVVFSTTTLVLVRPLSHQNVRFCDRKPDLPLPSDFVSRGYQSGCFVGCWCLSRWAESLPPFLSQDMSVCISEVRQRGVVTPLFRLIELKSFENLKG